MWVMNPRPVLASGSIEGLLEELATAIEDHGPFGVVVGADDALAIRWVLEELKSQKPTLTTTMDGTTWLIGSSHTDQWRDPE